MKNLGVLLCYIFFSVAAFAGGTEPGSQDTINHVDGNGKKQGYWIVTGKMKRSTSYKPEQKVEEGSYQTSRKIGLWRKYFPNNSNSISSEITYRSGRPYGDYTLYFEDGAIEEKGFWSRNKQVGDFERNYDDGTPAQRFYFNTAGQRNGTQEYFYPNGKVAVTVQLTNGRKNGELVRYWPDGKVKERMKFNNGVLDRKSIQEFPATKDFAMAEVEIEDHSEEVAPAVEKDKEKVNTGTLNCNGYNKLFNRAGQITQEGHFKNCRMYEGKIYNYNSGLLVDIDVYHRGYFVGKGVAEEDDKTK